MIDTHCHPTYEGLIERVDEVIASARAAGVDRLICVGTSVENTVRNVELAQRHTGLFVTAGIHPHLADPDRGGHAAQLRPWLDHPKVVAVGEMGLDYHYPEPARKIQREAFAAQLALMHDFRGPGVIHNREATDDTLAVIGECGVAGDRLVFHCFTGSGKELDAILDAGAMVGFTGIVTFNNAQDLASASDRVPLDRLMIETDAPYLTPQPYRKVKVNEPKYVAQVAAFLAGRRGMSVEDFAAAVDANAERFFGLR